VEIKLQKNISFLLDEEYSYVHIQAKFIRQSIYIHKRVYFAI